MERWMQKVSVGVRLIVAAVALTIAAIAPAQAQKLVALLVGNNAYQNVIALKRPSNDAHTLAEVLRKLNFSVFVAENLSRRGMSEALLTFDKAIEPGDTAFFFFAGHGFEIHGQNYLLPTDVPAAGEGQEELIRDAGFLADRIVERLQARGARTVVLVLDACRNNPFERPGARGIAGNGGLAPMTPVEGVFIVFSAGAKQLALDGLSRNDPDPNSVFTRVFARHLSESGLTLVQVTKRTQAEVKRAAAAVGHEQTPAYYDQVVGEIFLGSAGAQLVGLPSAITKSLPSGPASVIEAPGNDELVELEALAAAESWVELGERLTEVKPSARDAHWNTLVEQAALGELTPLAGPSRTSVTERLAAVDRYYPKFPSLRSSKKFLALHTAIGQEAFARCFDDAYTQPALQRCRDGFEGFVRNVPITVDTARAAGVLVSHKLNRSNAAPFFAMAFEVAGGDGICAEQELPSVIINALERPLDDPDAKAGLVLAERCWESVQAPIVANVASESGNSYFVRNICPILTKNRAVNRVCAELDGR
jgi:hypothetical protein